MGVLASITSAQFYRECGINGTANVIVCVRPHHSAHIWLRPYFCGQHWNCKYFYSHVWVPLSTMKETNFFLGRSFVTSFHFDCIVSTTASLEGWEIGTHPPDKLENSVLQSMSAAVMPAHTVHVQTCCLLSVGKVHDLNAIRDLA